MNGPRWCLNSLPSNGSTPPVLPWKPPQNPSTSVLPVAAWASRSAASTASAPPENIWIRVSPSGVTDETRSRNLARVSVEREARPRVDVQRHQVARRGRDRVTAVHFEAERGGGAADEPRERALVHRVAGQLLVLVIEPAEPGRLAMRAAAGADPVELDQITRDVRLQHGARDPAPGEPPQRSLDLAGRRREHDVAFLRVVDVAALHPDRERPRFGALARRDDAARDERHVGLVEDGDHPVTIGVVHRAWG